MNKYISTSPEQTCEIGKRLFDSLSTDAFVALYGDLGAGKTAFVKGMVSSFLPDAIVTSPTYNIVNTYENGPCVLHHYDMYRITDDEDLYSVGFYDNLEGAVVVAEWCENIPYAIPEKHIKVTITKDPNDENTRHIEMEFVNVDPCI